MKMEVWRPVVGYEGLYEVSSFGRIKSLRLNRMLKCQTDRKGYCTILLSKDGLFYGYKVHRLVAFAFQDICGEYFENATVNHKDENKSNNHADNLEWMSLKDNVNYGTGKYRRGKTQGVLHQKKVYVIDHKTGNKLYQCSSITEASEKTGVRLSTISSIIHKKNYYHQSNGYSFELC